MTSTSEQQLASLFQNPYFDVNILDHALENPNIQLTIPLPKTDGNYTNLPNNVPPGSDFSILLHFIEFFSGYNFKEVYSTGEYYYSMNKFNPQFKKDLDKFIQGKLEHDEYLDKLIYDLLDKELNLNLIKSKDLPVRFKEVKQFMIHYYQQENDKNFPIFAESKRFVRICYYTVIKLLNSMFPDGIWCNNLEVSRLYQQYLEDPMSIVFLPCHKSHVDYIIMHILSIRFQLSIPTVIAGDNLNVAIFGKILKKLGAIYIKRSFNNELYTERNLENLMEFFVLNNVNLEVFIEGTRSRDGKLLLPKYGILKMLEQIHERTNKDMILQPLSISYERIYETDGYLKELIGKDKKQESFTGIIKNGVVNLFGNLAPPFDINKIITKKLPYDNMDLKLSGKIFVKFGDNFKMSTYPNNLKKVGFTLLHEINSINNLSIISIVGTVLQLMIYLHPDRKVFPVKDMTRCWKKITRIIRQEINENNTSNVNLFNYLESINDEQLEYMIKYQIIKFFKYIKVDTKTNEILINNSIELLYYKNLIIHLLINRSIVCFSLLKSNFKNYDELRKVTYSIKSLLKNEFLFDYNQNPRDKFEFLVEDLINGGLIDENLQVKDKFNVSLLASLVYPFLKSYNVCVGSIIGVMDSHKSITEEKLINDQLQGFPDTKQLLKIIQQNNQVEFEATNKQYLLSCLYYLNHLNLIKIFKNKSKTKAFVIIQNGRNLMIVNRFLNHLFEGDDAFEDINYVVDIMDKKQRVVKM